MNRRVFVGSLLLPAATLRVLAADPLENLIDEGRKWMQEQLDPAVLRSVERLAPGTAKQLLGHIQELLGGQYVLDLAAVREAAVRLVPLLARDEATAPMADWLRARLAYLQVAEELRRQTPVPEPKPGQPPPPRPQPTAELERRAWQKQIEQTPAPRGSLAYARQLKPRFVAEKVPGELVWLAEVESSFNPKARSPAGAAGLFQLMPATARSLGLSLSPRDERLDPWKSAGAAARYLRHLVRRFPDWRLALAAYNCGEGRLQRLQESTGAKSFDALSPRLPAETQMYVPRVEAVLRWRENQELTRLPRA